MNVAYRPRFPVMLLLTLVLALVSAQLGPSSAQVQSQPPQVYRAAVDLIVSDVTVVGRDDAPVEGLTAADFAVTVDGSPRRIVTLTPLRAATATPGAPAAAPAAGGGQAVSPSPSGGRTFFIVVDRESIDSGQGRSHLDAAARFVDGLGPDDRVGLWTLPNPRPVKDREELKRELRKAVGTRRERYMPLAETLVMLENTIDALVPLDGTKHLMLITGATRVTPDDLSAVIRLGQRAAAARVHLHAMQIWQVLGRLRTDSNPYSEAHLASVGGAGRGAPLGDPNASAEAMLARETGGITVTSPQGPAAFTRLARELSTWYVMGVEPLPGDRDGQPHRLRVSVPQVKGVTVRARQTFTIPRAGG